MPAGHDATLRTGRAYLKGLDAEPPPLKPLPPGRRATAPHLEAGTVWWPAEAGAFDGAWRQAALAHVAAHVRHGGAPFERGLRPMTQAVLGVLEDVRVERLAAVASPGLLRQWRGWHGEAVRAWPGLRDGLPSVEALLLRLSQALLDPAVEDPAHWVAKGRSLFEAAAVDGLPPREALPAIARDLGRDLGQMRLRFAADRYRPQPGYRDDNAHLWTVPPELGQPIEVPADAPPPPAAGPSRTDAAGAPGPLDEAAPDDAPVVRVHRHPEWDWRIGGLRPQWCTVREREAPVGDAAGLAWPVLPAGRATDRSGPWRREEDGEVPHWGAWLDAAIERRLGRGGGERLYRVPRPRPPRLDVLLLVDTSASTVEPLPAAGRRRGGWAAGTTVLQALRGSALALAQALERSGQRCAIAGFASNTRHDLRWVSVKSFDEPAASPEVAARAAGLRSAWSTRLGTAVRHGTRVLRRAAAATTGPSRQPVLVLLSDGEPHDVDVHDRRTLPADLRHALREAQRAGVVVRQPPLGDVAAAWALLFHPASRPRP
ncbi:nitric oxide reductase activation protein NorD [Aquabacterium sp. J223]|uniref:nitric oxide reductase activation protein NorD n=1 Tax=Aquabacterium sp. J223 TaxID=2898431 RepID=UPI0021AD9074|nr:hypothetical protein [Aquabacterium sp. J223]UUX95604.1 hypothetical protein LRS07_20775 [Aquabacterium sp. J223]